MGEKKLFDLTLRNIIDSVQLIMASQVDLLGARLQKISKNDKYAHRILSRIRMSKLVDGKLKRAGIKMGI